MLVFVLVLKYLALLNVFGHLDIRARKMYFVYQSLEYQYNFMQKNIKHKNAE